MGRIDVVEDRLVGIKSREIYEAPGAMALITAHKAGLTLVTNDLEAHYLAGGSVERVLRALISADKAGIPLTFKQATAIDLAGRDVFEALQVSVSPTVRTTPTGI